MGCILVAELSTYLVPRADTGRGEFGEAFPAQSTLGYGCFLSFDTAVEREPVSAQGLYL